MMYMLHDIKKGKKKVRTYLYHNQGLGGNNVEPHKLLLALLLRPFHNLKAKVRKNMQLRLENIQKHHKIQL